MTHRSGPSSRPSAAPSEGISPHGASQDCIDRRRPDRRHARPSCRPQGTRRRRAVRHRRGHPAGQVARSCPVIAGRRLRCEIHRREFLRRDRRRERVHRHRRRAAQARHEPRRSSRHQPEGDGAGRRRHPQICAGCVRHLHHQSARRDGVGAAAGLRLPKSMVVGMAGVLDSRRASAISWPTSSMSRSRT